MNMKNDELACKENRKQILIAVDDSDSSHHAIVYAAGFLKNIPEIDITIFNVLSLPDEEFFKTVEERKSWINSESIKAEKLLQRFEELLIREGIEKGAIVKKFLMRKSEAISQSIISETREKGYCTVVVGRRHISRKEEFLFGSTSSELLHNLPENVCLWIVE